MPQLEIRTNLRLSQIPANFNQKATEMLSTLISCLQIAVIPNQLVTFGGTSEPCALVTLNSIGNISCEENRVNCKNIHSFLETELSLPSKRVFIIFNNVHRNDLAYDEKIFEDILPKE
ncbi:hypothetical protein TYRP_000250 [Tyrophagus putrescentiae]|nr:hypothetical protein TYRP_000250 [Tyrophagus putrescentiae]